MRSVSPSLHSPTSSPAWAAAVLHTAQEFLPTPLPVLEGRVPGGLQGTLYRNGPGRLERGGQRMGHWFDGDGAILAVRFAKGAATATYRYVQTAGYRAEEAAGRLLFGNYGMTPPGPLWTRFGKLPKNVANTSVLALGDRLLALWEAGLPHALDLETLETLGAENVAGLDGLPFSAHPKRDGRTGEIFNFGVSFGHSAVLNLYHCAADGTVKRRAAIPLEGIPLVHDFVLAGRYLVFLVNPVRIKALPLLLNLQSASDAFTWKPEMGTQIWIFDRESLSLVSRGEAEPWFQWHLGNGAETAEGDILLNLVRYPDFSTNQFLKEVATGHTTTRTTGTLWELRLDPQSVRVLGMSAVVERGCEFPTVAPRDVGQPWKHTYLTVHLPKAEEQGELFGAIARYDHTTDTLTVAAAGPRRYVVEPIFAPDPEHPAQGWLLTVVYDGDRHQSEVWIYAGDRLEAGPICRLGLPSVIPIGFHGTWRSA
ncbi:carotenoid oxygenase family protein [Thermoleptolyngbya sp. C42_A2020_037]|uniref:carotenoid oxygenase family protein n=1 Tax=Thermoleptolyngbya sp. C42_A2020_037 TaxID=2747799 RepID=UPI0019DCA7EB|nr:carotenoid oxygenase family protein [Thermoleptolyngbya sp. C42_A2020_037]MBF2086203.1 carotenoid oxygenase family protein [Thermoleptolyngbya sp. C42_A2020_037]